MSKPIKCLELFSGIGGFSAAIADNPKFQIVAALDISQLCARAYCHNFSHPVKSIGLESISWHRLSEYQADLWWLSPPCQPYTSRGLQRDLNDRRSQALMHLIDAMQKLRPSIVLLENVPGFQNSQSAERLRRVLKCLGYEFYEWLICPSWLGIANRRLRYYLLASLEPLFQEDPLAEFKADRLRVTGNNVFPDNLVRRVVDFSIEDNWGFPELQLAPSIVQRFSRAMDWVDAENSAAITTCFTAAYGRSPVYSGSFLRREDRCRYFSPEEILLALGFPPEFGFPSELSTRQKWSLVGNSLSVDSVRLLVSLF